MKSLIACLSLLFAVSSFVGSAHACVGGSCWRSSRLGHCSILFPGKRDKSGAFCNQGFAVMYDGYVSNGACYGDVTTALDAMRRTRACERSSRQGHCSILFPGKRDKSGAFCNQGFAVMYEGYVKNGACYGDIDSAMDSMRFGF